MKLILFPADTTGCGYYRMTLPHAAMEKLGHTVKVAHDLRDAFKEDYDIYVFQRVMTPQVVTTMKELKRRGKYIILDHDDDLFNLYPGHPSSGFFAMAKQCISCGHSAIYENQVMCPNCGSKKLQLQDRRANIEESLRIPDLITVSTRELIHIYNKGKVTVKVIPNYIDISLYPTEPNFDDDNVIIGWAGSSTHALDLSDASHVGYAMAKYPNAYLQCVGAEPVVMEQKLGGGVPEGHFSILTPSSVDDYPTLISNFNIGLAPILNNAFNRGKSHLKAMEYGAAWCPTIASDVTPYIFYLQSGTDGFLCSKPRQWAKAVDALLSDNELRHKMALNARRKAEANDINKNIGERIAIYESLLAGEYDDKRVSISA